TGHKPCNSNGLLITVGLKKGGRDLRERGKGGRGCHHKEDKSVAAERRAGCRPSARTQPPARRLRGGLGKTPASLRGKRGSPDLRGLNECRASTRQPR